MVVTMLISFDDCFPADDVLFEHPVVKNKDDIINNVNAKICAALFFNDSTYDKE